MPRRRRRRTFEGRNFGRDLAQSLIAAAFAGGVGPMGKVPSKRLPRHPHPPREAHPPWTGGPSAWQADGVPATTGTPQPLSRRLVRVALWVGGSAIAIYVLDLLGIPVDDWIAELFDKLGEIPA